MSAHAYVAGEGPAAFIERRVTSNDGLSLFVRDYPGPRDGGKTPLLCLGGLTRNSKDFAGIAKYHARHRRVVCPDMRGRGRSAYDPDWRNYRPETYIGDIRDIACALGLHGVIVVGTSLGGILGMAMGAAMPTILRGLILNDVGPRVETRTLDKVVAYMQAPPTLTTWEEAGRHLKSAFGDQIPIGDDAVWVQAARNSYVERSPGKITYDWDDNLVKPVLADKTEVYDLWHLFTAVRRVSTLVVRGQISSILPRETLAEMADRHLEMQSVTVPRVGHAPSLGEPECIAAIDTFLESL